MVLLNRLFIIAGFVFSVHASAYALCKAPLDIDQKQEAKLCFDVLRHQDDDGRSQFMRVVLSSKQEVVVGVCKAMQEKLSADQIFEILSLTDNQGYTVLVLAVIYERAEAIDVIGQLMSKLSYNQLDTILYVRGPVGIEPNGKTVKALEQLMFRVGFFWLIID